MVDPAAFLLVNKVHPPPSWEMNVTDSYQDQNISMYQSNQSYDNKMSEGIEFQATMSLSQENITFLFGSGFSHGCLDYLGLYQELQFQQGFFYS